MQERIWENNPRPFSQITGSEDPTPFGAYSGSTIFEQDAIKTSKWAANRLGYPIQNIELIDINFYACFEEAVLEYGAQVNQFNIRNNLDTLEGQSTQTDVTQRVVTGTNLQTVIEMSDSYGAQAQLPVGGNVDRYTGFVELKRGVQYYDVASGSYVSNQDPFNYQTGSIAPNFDKIQVTRVFYEEAPAITRFFDPFSTTGIGTINTITAFGFGGFSPASQFVLMPLYEDLLRMQAIELNDQLRKSDYTFHIVNNKLQIFPIPNRDRVLFFEFMDESEQWRQQAGVRGGSIEDDQSEAVVSDYSNVPYSNIPYDRINDVGKQWIRKYTLALAKELLGAIREKYSTVPIPDADISLDGASLRSEAQTEKDMLMTQLRENLEELSRRNRMEIKNQESEYQQDMLRRIPLPIFVG